MIVHLVPDRLDIGGVLAQHEPLYQVLNYGRRRAIADAVRQCGFAYSGDAFVSEKLQQHWVPPADIDSINLCGDYFHEILLLNQVPAS
jgi:hypothetical protein